MRNTRPGASASLVCRLLKQWRAHQWLSQLALAAEAGMSPRHLSFIESGRAPPSGEMLALLGKVLGGAAAWAQRALTAT